MRQNKQSDSLFCPRRFVLLLVAVASFLCLAVVNSERTRAQQPNANSATQKPRTKRLTPLRTSDTPDGSRATITSDGELNDYSAYRSGDRFIVVVPQAEGAGGGGARGRGFEGAQVERRGKDVVYTFKLQPGATARVNQRFNRLDVQFSAPKGAGGNTANANARPTPAPTPRRPLPEEAGITNPTANANSARPTPEVRRTPDANANSSGVLTVDTQPTPLNAASPNASPLSGVVPSPTLAPTVAPSPGMEQIAQVQPTIAPPVSITTNTTPANAPTSVGAVVLRNWPWLIAALLAVGIGLLFVSRFSSNRDQSRGLPPATPTGTKPSAVKETKPAELKPTSAATAAATIGATNSAANAPATGVTGTNAAGTSAAGSAAIAAGTAATAANLATSGKQSKKKKKKTEKAKRQLAANELKAGGADAGTGAADAATTTTDSGVGAGVIASIVVAGAAGAAGGASAVEESNAAGTKAGESKAIEAVAPQTQATETPAVAFDPERIEVEIKKLLAGESYDESLINTTDAGTRQLVSAELMQAVAGRNAERKAHARTAFLKHGYFEEATRALQSAEAPGERASAARTLGLYGDRSATPHLTAALEDPAADVRRTTVEALAELADPAAVGALEALRWRETSRQVPRALIQRAIEASKAAEEEETAATAAEADDDTPTLVTPTPAEAATALAATETPELETKEIELKEAEAGVAATAVVVAEEPDAQTADSPVLTVSVTETPETAVAVEEAPVVAIEAAPTVETSDAIDEAKIDEAEVEAFETKALELASPQVEAAPLEEVTAEFETTAATPAETDLAATLAAKEASLIKAREQQAEAQTADSFVAASTETSFDTSADMAAPVNPEAASAETVTTKADGETSPVYHSDFAVGSGKEPAAARNVWSDADADEHEVTIQSIEPLDASAAPPAEPLGTFYAEGLHAAPEAGRGEESASLFDSLEVETFETNEITVAEPTPVTAKPVDFELVEDTPTQPLTRERRPSFDEDSLRGTEVVKADKGLSLADGSDEESYSIIPKGIQVRLASEDASERAASVLALSRLNTNEAFNEICVAFDDPAEEVRNAAARALYDLNEDRADSFTRALRESPLERRRQIGAALAGSGLADEAVSNLTGESRDKTYDAFSLLFLMAKAGEVVPLIRAIESHHDNEVRLAVVKLLALSGQHDILPAFRRLAVRGSLPTEVRSAVMEAIYQISSQPQNATPAT
ncbi:MAG TPA: HEAT repeat domain-containing protein [Pyrinomonadaceae bacterium]|jgi:HEAT repeat protein